MDKNYPKRLHQMAKKDWLFRHFFTFFTIRKGRSIVKFYIYIERI